MTQPGDRRGFAQKRPEHVVILARGDKIRHMTIRPWMAAVTVCLIAVLSVAYLAATAYLFFRDDLIRVAVARQSHIQQEYEDRIAALRTQLDSVTSRHLMDQQVLQQKVEKLLEQQDALFSRHGKLGPLLERAQESGLMPAGSDGPAGEDPERQASVGGGIQAIDALLGYTAAASAPGLAYAPLRESRAERTDLVFSRVDSSLRDIEQEQLAKIAGLTVDASRTADAIASILKRTGVNIDALTTASDEGVGGPLLEPETAVAAFDDSVHGLDAALSRLEAVRETAKALPYGSPAPGRTMTSRYGNRVDPFLGRLALHAGIDFRASTGEKVFSAGAGKVVAAEFSGGYGNLVEIDHGYGITTRYGHLSRILVSAGDEVSAGAVIGRAGSTGRSTGPHIHYEVRRDGRAIDPVHFLNAGMKLGTYLN
ncbi:MAG: peptidoglycan DD-metalloendopeptidase family protein [Alphaproteobacteria bacterium]|nr:peptidoglycan DD-metalloendopeptidase family protein [Alphaproteobacteria bacterium]MBU1550902.1 peptidoglycan DD-metalloendopeptidase family protein [Alphaproteobacteria bacterium]MBU2339038.1 peptidoglycan DD-metalloendopeptidase family protein [Alphaproteobacteria bacterium]MBU2387129.1 peptidoglycan DD-metalloendopeptidase family protein [Alphaproteobacteria bacterium]